MKTERGKLENIQKRRLREWCDAGAVCIVSTDAAEVVRLALMGEGNWPVEKIPV